MWRGAYAPQDVTLIAICVEHGRPERVAREFQQQIFGDGGVINGFIDDPEDFPDFPIQLGCQGLVVLNGAGEFVTTRSPAYLDLRGGAFRAVERMLEPLIPARAVSSTEAYVAVSVANCPKTSPPPCSQTEAYVAEVHLAERTCADCASARDGAYLDIPSVGHASMDEEHEEINDAMHKLLMNLSISDVHALVALFAKHAEHEETLMRRSGYGIYGGKGTLSGKFESHAADHAAIVVLGTSLIDESDIDGVLVGSRAEHLCRRIVEHAVEFDSLYAGALQAN